MSRNCEALELCWEKRSPKLQSMGSQDADLIQAERFLEQQKPWGVHKNTHQCKVWCGWWNPPHHLADWNGTD
ncbi:Hypothetical predicted protein [Podarcis lilfordi]|uniref:Uncharacterized protein n=1 Tax=Podarcis lilfordi TaxID=74358 RepID=A0AA35KGP6_9SAUR|nr:Hypothetical predicted protein [Podarcis lilfordi]